MKRQILNNIFFKTSPTLIHLHYFRFRMLREFVRANTSLHVI